MCDNEWFVLLHVTQCVIMNSLMVVSYVLMNVSLGEILNGFVISSRF